MMRILYSGGAGFFLGVTQTYDNPLYEPIFWAANTVTVANAFYNMKDGLQGNISLTVQNLCTLSLIIGFALGRIAGGGIEFCYDGKTLINYRGLMR